MLSFFDFIFDIIGIVWQAVINGITSLVDFVIITYSAINFSLSIPSLVPGIIGASVLAVIVIGLLKLFIAVGGNQ